MKMQAAFFIVLLVLVCFGNAEDGDRIVGDSATEAGVGEFPYFVNIVERANKRLICSGILLESRVVLTTAEAFILEQRPFKANEILIEAGIHTRYVEDSEVSYYRVKKVLVHPLAEKNIFYRSFALLKLKTEPELNARVQVLGLNRLSMSAKDDSWIIRDDENCVVPAFGAISAKGQAIVKLPRTMVKFTPTMKPPKFCKAASWYKKKELLCSMNEDGTNICEYDMGAPLLCTVEGETRLYGLSHLYIVDETEICKTGWSFYARISTYSDWITENTLKMMEEY